MEQQKNMAEVIKESFTQYSGAVLQSRALVDVRDCIKPSARQILYCLYTDKFLHNKPFKKTMKALGSAMRLYIHGDASCVGVMMRNGQPFAMRYPLTEVEGNGGNIIETGNWAAPRYTGTRLSELSSYLMQDIKKKDIISEWRDNYDDTEKYPAVLPSKGFYNIVNGTSGIGIGMGSSCPQFNIKDVNAALEKLLLNPDIDFEEIYCTPDFATGGYLINEKEVKEALKYGSKQKAKDNDAEGASCKLRAKIEIDPEDSEGRTQYYKTGIMNDPDLTNRLYEKKVKFSQEIVEKTSPLMSILLTWILPTIVIIALTGTKTVVPFNLAVPVV